MQAVALRFIALALVAAGCDRVFEIQEVGDRVAPTDGYVCYGTGLVQVCGAPTTGDLVLSGQLNTNDALCMPFVQSTNEEMCMVSARSITISDPLSIVGPRPLLLVAATRIDVHSTIDASSQRGAKLGPGAQQNCGSGGTGSDGTTGSAGGAGGTFGFRGGNGASGQGGAAAGFESLPVTPLLDVRGGCPGFRGGSTSGSPRANGGGGGGALYLLAGETIEVVATGSINASGGAGQGGAIGAGGGGGGAGGFIGLDAPMVIVAGDVFARGGGGGGGGGTTAGGDGSAASSTTAGSAGGLAGGSAGGSGAPGCAGPNGTAGGLPTTNPATAGGGGAGGGCGYVRIYGTRVITGTPFSPAPTP